MSHKESMQMLRNRTDEVIRMMDVPLAKSDVRSRNSPGLAAKPTGGDGDVGTTLQTRLQSLKHLRLQIEDLARKHKLEEDTLTTAVQQILQQNTQNKRILDQEFVQMQAELAQLREERKRVIQMCERFKTEGDQVIHRMHETIQNLQKEVLAEREQRLAVEQQCQARLAHAKAVLVSQREQIERGSSPRNARFERVTAEYASLLEDAQSVISEIREENETMKMLLMSTADNDSHSALLQDYVLRLREEKRNRMQTEEQSQRMFTEQHRSITALEERLRQAEKRNSAPRNKVNDDTLSLSPNLFNSPVSYQLSSPEKACDSVPKPLPVPKQQSPVPKQQDPVPKQQDPVPKQQDPVPKPQVDQKELKLTPNAAVSQLQQLEKELFEVMSEFHGSTWGKEIIN